MSVSLRVFLSLLSLSSRLVKNVTKTGNVERGTSTGNGKMKNGNKTEN